MDIIKRAEELLREEEYKTLTEEYEQATDWHLKHDLLLTLSNLVMEKTTEKIREMSEEQKELNLEFKHLQKRLDRLI